MQGFRGENRRRFVRSKGVGRATVRRNGQADIEGRLHDISHNGAGLLLPEALEVGQTVTATILTPRMYRAELKGEVIHAQPQNDGQFVVGVKLDEWLTPESLQELRSANG